MLLMEEGVLTMTGFEMLVDLDKCAGCSACAVSCRSGNKVPDSEWRMKVRLFGVGSDGEGDPVDLWPELRAVWVPIYHKRCTMCADRVEQGKLPYCVACCRAKVLTFGDPADEESPVARERARLIGSGSRLFKLPLGEDARGGIVYATAR